MTKLASLLAILALALVGAGTATAAKLLSGKDVRNGSLTGADLKNGSVAAADLAAAARPVAGRRGPAGPTGPAGAAGVKGAQGPAGAAGADSGYTKAQADARFHPKDLVVPDSAKLTGIERDDLAVGKGEVTWGVADRSFNTAAVTLADLGEIGTVQVRCLAGGDKRISIVNTTGDGLNVARSQRRAGTSAVVGFPDAPADATTELAAGTMNYAVTLQVYRTGAINEMDTVVVSATDDNASTCAFMGHVVNSRL